MGKKSELEKMWERMFKMPQMDLSAAGIHPVENGKVKKPKQSKQKMKQMNMSTMSGYEIPSMKNIDWAKLDAMYDDMFTMRPVAESGTSNVPPDKYVIVGGKAYPKGAGSKAVSSKPRKEPSPSIMNNWGGIPTLGDVMQGSKGMEMPSLFDVTRGQPDMGRIPSMSDVGTGIVQTIKGVNEAVEGTNRAYRTIRNTFAVRHKKYKKALGNPTEDEFHPDNLQTMQKGYDEYVINPMSGKPMLMEDYVKLHNQYYLAGKTPSSKRSIVKDLRGRIKNYRERKQAEHKLEQLQEYGRNQQERLGGGGESETMTMEKQPAQTLTEMEMESPDQNNIFAEAQSMSTMQPELPDLIPREQTSGQSGLFDTRSDQERQESTESPLPLPETPENVQGHDTRTWCFYIKENSTTGFGGGQNGTSKCYQGWDQATMMQRQFRSRGFEVSGLFEKTR